MIQKKLKRKPATRKIKKIILIATEGKKTEPEYFSYFKRSFKDNLQIITIKTIHKPNPKNVLNRLKDKVSSSHLNTKYGDSAWMVIDKDSWTGEELNYVYTECAKLKYKIALSNPKFELWLLYHFEDIAGAMTSAICSKKLKKHIPNYDKGISPSTGIFENVQVAISRAKKNDNPPCHKWPTTNGTTVYRLMEEIV